MDNVLLLKKHIDTYTISGNLSTMDRTTGNNIEAPYTDQVEGAFLPMKPSELMRLETVDSAYEYFKFYTKSPVIIGSSFIDKNNDMWTVFDKLRYNHIADLKVYALRIKKDTGDT